MDRRAREAFDAEVGATVTRWVVVVEVVMSVGGCVRR